MDMCNKVRKIVSSLFGFLTPSIVAGVFLCACSTAVPSEAVSQNIMEETAETPAVSETTAETTVITETTEPSLTSASSAETSVESSTGISEEETKETQIIDAGYGSYGFLKDGVRFHSQNDISMMIGLEDTTIYDYGARDSVCRWIDIFYIEDAFDMTSFDYSFRFLSFYNDDTSVTFSGYKEIGTWKTPKGSDLELYLAGITIISDNLEIRILPKDTGKPDDYNISVNGRGYYVSEEQLQMADFVLSSLMEDPGTDPLEGIVSGADHTYYF